MSETYPVRLITQPADHKICSTANPSDHYYTPQQIQAQLDTGALLYLCWPGFVGRWLLGTKVAAMADLHNYRGSFVMAKTGCPAQYDSQFDSRSQSWKHETWGLEDVLKLYDLYAERRDKLCQYAAQLPGVLSPGFTFKHTAVIDPDIDGVFTTVYMRSKTHRIKISLSASDLCKVESYLIPGPGRQHKLNGYHDHHYHSHEWRLRLDFLATGYRLRSAQFHDHGYMPDDAWFEALKNHVQEAMQVNPKSHEFGFTTALTGAALGGKVTSSNKLITAQADCVCRIDDKGRIRKSGIEQPGIRCWYLVVSHIINCSQDTTYAWYITDLESVIPVTKNHRGGDVIGTPSNKHVISGDLGPGDKLLLEAAVAAFWDLPRPGSD